MVDITPSIGYNDCVIRGSNLLVMQNPAAVERWRDFVWAVDGSRKIWYYSVCKITHFFSASPLFRSRLGNNRGVIPICTSWHNPYEANKSPSRRYTVKGVLILVLLWNAIRGNSGGLVAICRCCRQSTLACAFLLVGLPHLCPCSKNTLCIFRGNSIHRYV